MAAVAHTQGTRRLHRVPQPTPAVAVDDSPGVLHRAATTVAGDARRWWLVAAEPPSLTVWLANLKPHRVPDDARALRWAWLADNYLTGALLGGVSVALFLIAAGLRWVAAHPARRWLFLLLAAVGGTWMWLA